MKIGKRASLAAIGLILAASVGATTIQSDGTLTLTSNVIFDSSIDAQVSDVRFALSDTHDLVMISPSSVFEFRTTELMPLRANIKQATFAFLMTNRIAARPGKRHEIGWRI